MRHHIEEARIRNHLWDVVSMRYWLAKLLVQYSQADARAELQRLIKQATELDHRFVLEDARKMLEELQPRG